MESLDTLKLMHALHQCEKTAAHNRQNGRSKIYAFLDFDGVINVFYPPGSSQYEHLVELSKQNVPFQFSDEDCLKRLSSLCLDYDINLIISSSWRYSGLAYCQDYLVKGGLDKNVKVTGMTSDVIGKTREELILRYLQEHPDYSGFLILDDMPMPHLYKYLVHCDSMHGYDEKQDEKARQILQDQHLFPITQK